MLTGTDNQDELSDADYLRDLAERLRDVPVMYGTDGYDIDRLREIASTLGETSQASSS